ncbi:competence/damage-inducible protein A [Pontivivens insulae]|uniref:Nicotinamide-nucleotide amidohydrolase PncC n=1 Tax=Pontivivens insulae TaxID=1639689 RepID=A0A2R8A6Y9_9RHOB|nr:molybdopterin-binding protein [Pontivivens insulae]RED18107.1 molybdenum cofactor synthesis domain-containing protein [Pontivivens insulae]SPF28004.1 Nicotinamide-nucleotide amidohydrolase PncC [Pontivivens insulae]
MSQPTAAMIVIGDEILSGRTADVNVQVLAVALGRAGIALAEVRMIRDIEGEIIDAVNVLREKYDNVFTSGGIGPTHDDITADSIAAAFGVGIDVREDARAILATNYANPEAELNDMRLRMARIPDGATLIDNPVSKAPGFTLGNVHVMAGVPKIFSVMVESVMPTLTGGAVMLSEELHFDRGEGQLAKPLSLIDAAHPLVSIGSYPRAKDGRFTVNVVARSTDADALAAAVADIRAID